MDGTAAVSSMGKIKIRDVCSESRKHLSYQLSDRAQAALFREEDRSAAGSYCVPTPYRAFESNSTIKFVIERQRYCVV